MCDAVVYYFFIRERYYEHSIEQFFMTFITQVFGWLENKHKTRTPGTTRTQNEQRTSVVSGFWSTCGTRHVQHGQQTAERS